MSDTMWGIVVCLCIAAGFGLIWYFIIRPKKEQKVVKGDVNLGMNKDQFGGIAPRGKTPNGAELIGTVNIPLMPQQNLEIGCRNAYRRVKAKHPEWNLGFSISDAAFEFVNPQATTENGEPAIFVSKMVPTESGISAIQQVKAAGTIIGLSAHTGPDRPYIVLPHQEASGWKYNGYLMGSVLHEMIHFLEWLNDPNEFIKHEGLSHEDFDTEYPSVEGEEAAI